MEYVVRTVIVLITCKNCNSFSLIQLSSFFSYIFQYRCMFVFIPVLLAVAIPKLGTIIRPFSYRFHIDFILILI